MGIRRNAWWRREEAEKEARYRLIPVIDEGDHRRDTFFFRSIQPKPKNPIMAEKPLMSPIKLRASLSSSPSLQHIVSSSTQSDYQCLNMASMFRLFWSLPGLKRLMNACTFLSFPKSEATEGLRKEWRSAICQTWLTSTWLSGRRGHKTGCETTHWMWKTDVKHVRKASKHSCLQDFRLIMF